jgi:transcriptional regulator with XRE-family HTH domain
MCKTRFSDRRKPKSSLNNVSGKSEPPHNCFKQNNIYSHQTHKTMPNLHLKIKAIRLLRRLSQSETANLAHIHIKTYQRKEAAISSITDQDLEQLSAPFNCTAEDIRKFDLETNTFSEMGIVRIRELEVENKYLKSEVTYLRQLIDKATTPISRTKK